MGERDTCDQKHLQGHRGKPLKSTVTSFLLWQKPDANVPNWNGTLRLYTTKGVGLLQQTFPVCGGAVGGVR